MRMKFFVVVLLAASAVTSLSAHITVSPLQSKTGATQAVSCQPRHSTLTTMKLTAVPLGVIV
jgi:hypothetical protein